MEFKIGSMIEVDGEFGNIVGLEGETALVFMLRRGETVLVPTSRIKGIEVEAAKSEQNTGEPEEPKGAADTAIGLWSMGYRGKALFDQMAELGFSEAETKKAVDVAQQEYWDRREDGGGYWEIQVGERLKLANGEWGTAIEAEKDGSVGVEFSDGKRELLLVSDLDDQFVAGRNLIARIDRLIGMVEESISPVAEGDIEISYQAPGGARERKRFRNQEEMGKFLKEMEQSGQGKVEIEIGAAEPAEKPEAERPTKWGPIPKTPIKLKVEEPQEKGLRERLEEQMEKGLVQPLESKLEPIARTVVEMDEKVRAAEKELKELKAKRDKYWQEIGGPEMTQVHAEELAKMQEMYMDLQKMIYEVEGGLGDGEEMLRRMDNVLFRIRAVLKGGKYIHSGSPRDTLQLLLTQLSLDKKFPQRPLNMVYKYIMEVLDAHENVKYATDAFIELTPSAYRPTKWSASIKEAGLLDDVRQFFRGAWESIKGFGRWLREAIAGTDEVEQLVDRLESEVDRQVQRESARISARGFRRQI